MPSGSYLDYLTPEDRAALAEENQAVKSIKPGSKAKFLNAFGSAPALTGSQEQGGEVNPQSKFGTYSRAREGGGSLEWRTFLDDATEAWLASGQQYPVGWLVHQSPRDIALIADPEMTELILGAKQDIMMENQKNFELQQAIDRQVQQLTAFEEQAIRRLETADRGDKIGSALSGVTFGLSSVIGQLSDPHSMDELKMSVSPWTDDTPEERQARIREWVAANWDPTEGKPIDYWEYYAAAGGAGELFTAGQEFVGAGFKSVIDGVEGVMLVDAHVQDTLHKMLGKDPHVVRDMYNRAREIQNADAEYFANTEFGREDYGTRHPMLVEAAAAEAISKEAAWDYAKSQDPEGAEQMILSYGFGDERTAMAVFWQELKDNGGEELKTEIESIQQQLSDEEWGRLRALNEPDLSSTILDSIDGYGEWLQGVASYGVAIGVEMFEAAGAGAAPGSFDFRDVQRRVVDAENKPSNVVGLHGTIIGNFGLDLILPGVIDPLNIAFSPRLAARTARLFSPAHVKRMWHSPTGRTMVQELLMILRSGHRGSGAALAALDELGAVGLMDEARALAKGHKQVMPPGNYGPTVRRASHEVRTDALAEKFIGGRRKVVPDPSGHTYRELGQPAPVTVYVHRETGQAWLDPHGESILAAVSELDSPTVEIVIRESATAAPFANEAVALEEIGWTMPERFTDEGFASVRNNIPEEDWLGDADVEGMTELMIRAGNAGAGMSNPMGFARSRMWSSEVGGSLKAVEEGKEELGVLNRWFTAENTNTHYTLGLDTSARQIRHAIVRLWGDDPKAMNELLEEFDDILRAHAQGSIDNSATRGKLVEIKKRLKDYETRGMNLRGRNFQALNGADDAVLREIQENPDAFVFHSTQPERADIIAEKGHKKGGVTTQERAETVYTGEGGAAGGDEIVVYRKDDLFPFQQKALERNKGELGQLEIPEGQSGPKPVARYQNPNGVRAALEAADNTKTYQALRAEAQALERTLKSNGMSFDNWDIHDFMNRVWERYNREVIAPTGMYDVNGDGLVNWDDLRPGSRAGDWQIVDGRPEFVPSTKAKSVPSGTTFAGMDVEGFGAQAFGARRNVQSFVAPLSILDMKAASTLSRGKFLQYMEHRSLETAREMTWALLRLWKMDKVFRPATGMVATFDELFSIMQTGNLDQVFAWMEDKMMNASYHAKGALSKVTGGKVSGNPKWGRWARRSDELQSSVPAELNRMESAFEEDFGLGFADMTPKDPGYLEAAQRYIAAEFGDSGFRAALRGEEAFREWWDNSPDAAAWKRGTTRLADGSHVPTSSLDPKDLYDGYVNYFEHVILQNARKSGKLDDVRAHLRRYAEDIEAGGGRAASASVPNAALRQLGTIKGVPRSAPGGHAVTRATQTLGDMIFLNPSRNRRQFLSRLVKKYETARIHSLYEKQGIRVVPDDMIEAETGGAVALNRYHGDWGQVERLAREFSVVPKSWVDRLVNNKVVEEAEHLMYSWHRTSRIGRSMAGQAVVPFGGPWADMWGRYGRELLMPMVPRGILNRPTNMLGRAAHSIAEWAPNLKKASLLSRLAATDFNIDRGFAGEESFSLDFSPLVFLPTKGEDALSTMIPGFGLVPMVLMDRVIGALADPLEEPQKYQYITDQVANLIPAAGYAQQGAARALGGGMLATLAKLASDASAITSGQHLSWINDAVADIQGEVMTTRAFRAVLADPDNWDDLVNLSEGPMYDTILNSLTMEAYRRGAGAHAAEVGLRQLIPTRGDFDTAQDEVAEVWVEAARQFPELAPAGFDNLNMENGEAVGEAVDAIRESFWNLPNIERNKLIVQNPALVVNMVGGWVWTDKAQNQMPERTGTPYRSEGGREGLSLHENYIKQGLIRPISPGLLGHLMVGTYFNAREELATEAYSATVTARNDYIWENAVDEGWKSWLDQAATNLGIEGGGRAMWQKWDRYQGEYEDAWMEANGIDPATATDEQQAAYNIVLPEELAAWSTDWRGMEDENFAQRFRDVNIPALPPEAVDYLNTLGASITPDSGMTGAQFLNVLHQELSDDVVESPAKVRSLAEYRGYIEARSVEYNAGETALNAAAINRQYDEAWRQNAVRLLEIHEQNGNIQGDLGVVPPQRVNMLREAWTNLKASDPDSTLDYEEIWSDMFARNYGPEDWTPPEPPEDLSAALPVTEVRSVLDGDTIIVRTQEDQDQSFRRVRLLGLDALEANTEEGVVQRDRLREAIISTVNSGGTVQLVPDGDATGGRYTDIYGRQLAWLFLDGEPYSFPEEVSP